MNRRASFLALAVLAAAPSFVLSQVAAKLPVIATIVVSPGPPLGWPKSAYYQAFMQGLRDLGYVEGKQFVVQQLWSTGKAEDVPDFAKRLAAAGPDVILASGETSTRSAQRATTSTPIVIAYGGDPVRGGFAKSLAKPGGNITGVSTLNEDTSAKLLELLLEVLPKRPRLAVLGNPAVPSYASVHKNLEEAARRIGVAILTVEARSAAEIEGGFARMAAEKVGAVVVLGDPLIFSQRQQIADLALKYRMASVYPAREHVEAGGLISYGVNIVDGFRRAASFVDRILKGAKPGDLPIEQATALELAINLKTAKAIGVVIPQSLMLRADRVIE